MNTQNKNENWCLRQILGRLLCSKRARLKIVEWFDMEGTLKLPQFHCASPSNSSNELRVRIFSSMEVSMFQSSLNTAKRDGDSSAAQPAHGHVWPASKHWLHLPSNQRSPVGIKPEHNEQELRNLQMLPTDHCTKNCSSWHTRRFYRMKKNPPLQQDANRKCRFPYRKGYAHQASRKKKKKSSFPLWLQHYKVKLY